MNPTVSASLIRLTQWFPLAALAGMLSALPATAQENDAAQSIIGQMNEVLRNDAGHDQSAVQATVETLNRSLLSMALDEPGEYAARLSDEIGAGEVETPVAIGGSAAGALGGNTGDSANPAGHYLPFGDQEPFGGDPLEDTVVGYADGSAADVTPLDDSDFGGEPDLDGDGDGDSGGGGAIIPGSG